MGLDIMESTRVSRCGSDKVESCAIIKSLYNLTDEQVEEITKDFFDNRYASNILYNLVKILDIYNNKRTVCDDEGNEMFKYVFLSSNKNKNKTENVLIEDVRNTDCYPIYYVDSPDAYYMKCAMDADLPLTRKEIRMFRKMYIEMIYKK